MLLPNFTKTVSPVTYYGAEVHCGNSSTFEKKPKTFAHKLNLEVGHFRITFRKI